MRQNAPLTGRFGDAYDFGVAIRFLHFENIDMQQPDISAWCSLCGESFKGAPGDDERVDDVIVRLRARQLLTTTLSTTTLSWMVMLVSGIR
jgi:hypothetical protein